MRASANHVMRKFSMASITSNFSSKRSTSYTSLGSWRKDESAVNEMGRRDNSLTVRSNSHRPALVSFHTAPDAFLPADFELNPSIATCKSKKLAALRLLAATFDRRRSSTPSTAANENQKGGQGLNRAQSLRQRISKGTADETTYEKSAPWKDQLPFANREGDCVRDSAALPSGLGEVTHQTSKTPDPTAKRSKSKLLRLFQ
jgi:hypothetical protein